MKDFNTEYEAYTNLVGVLGVGPIGVDLAHKIYKEVEATVLYVVVNALQRDETVNAVIIYLGSVIESLGGYSCKLEGWADFRIFLIKSILECIVAKKALRMPGRTRSSGAARTSFFV